MRDLLDEYIADKKLDGKYDPLDLIEDLKRSENYERRLPDSNGNCNPYKEVL